jgi:hypothetical protein
MVLRILNLQEALQGHNMVPMLRQVRRRRVSRVVRPTAAGLFLLPFVPGLISWQSQDRNLILLAGPPLMCVPQMVVTHSLSSQPFNLSMV